MGSPLLWNSMQIGVKFVGNWLQMYTKLSNSSSNNLNVLYFVEMLFHVYKKNFWFKFEEAKYIFVLPGTV